MTPMKAYRHDKSNGDSIQDKYWNPVDCNSVRKKKLGKALLRRFTETHATFSAKKETKSKTNGYVRVEWTGSWILDRRCGKEGKLGKKRRERKKEAVDRGRKYFFLATRDTRQRPLNEVATSFDAHST